MVVVSRILRDGNNKIGHLHVLISNVMGLARMCVNVREDRIIVLMRDLKLVAEVEVVVVRDLVLVEGIGIRMRRL